MNPPLKTKALLAAMTLAFASASESRPLSICVTMPDVESIVHEIGGDQVQVLSFCTGPEDPHIVEIRPSFVKTLNKADLLVQVGLCVEDGWIDDLFEPVKSPRVKPGGKGNLNLGVKALVLAGKQGEGVDGSFHPEANPHYLLDPIEGCRAAREIAEKLTELRPAQKDYFEIRLKDFRRKIAAAFLGKEHDHEDPEEVAKEFEEAAAKGKLDDLLKKHVVGGWLKRSLAHRGIVFVGDHDQWPYFAHRYGLEILGHLEPWPGAPPTTKHLRKLIGEMKEKDVKFILTAPYFDPKPAHLVNRNTGATIVPTVHQTGGRPGMEAYLDMLEHNFNAVFSALEKDK